MSPEYPDFLQVAATRLIADEPVFVRSGSAASDAELTSCETALNLDLPLSYKTFLRVLGPGSWCGEVVKPASSLYAFDADCWEMRGFVGLVENVQGVGDHLAINPSDPVLAEERPLYYCGHDPFGYARLAESFESWTRMATESGPDGSMYSSMEDDIAESHRRYRMAQPKRWWQVWRRVRA